MRFLARHQKMFLPRGAINAKQLRKALLISHPGGASRKPALLMSHPGTAPRKPALLISHLGKAFGISHLSASLLSHYHPSKLLYSVGKALRPTSGHLRQRGRRGNLQVDSHPQHLHHHGMGQPRRHGHLHHKGNHLHHELFLASSRLKTRICPRASLYLEVGR